MTAQAHPMPRPRPCRIRGHHSRAQHAMYCRPTDSPPYATPDSAHINYEPADPAAYRALRRRLRRLMLTASAR
jgi:hypothetical protein